MVWSIDTIGGVVNIYKSGMCYVGKILQLSEIPEADFIQRAEVVCGDGGKWSGVVRKEVSEGDKVVVFLPDAVVPDIPQLEFMRDHKFRVKMMRMRGCPSEVLIIPADVMGIDGDVGVDVTDTLGVMKYEKEIPLSLSGIVAGAFPPFVPKTDVLNFQTVPHMRDALVGHPCAITTKMDGSSHSFYHRDDHLGGCSRNWELRDTPTAAVWAIAYRYGLIDTLPARGNIALQWECVGRKVQGNPLKLSQVEPRVFDVWDIDGQRYLDHHDARGIADDLSLPFVDATYIDYIDYSDDELRTMAEGVYESGVQREGIVVRPVREMMVDGERLSFKVINLAYKGG